MARRKEFKTEAALAVKLIAWLEQTGWEVFQEVRAPSGRHDIVARQEDALWVIECKLAFNIQVLSQAWDARNYANWISVAVPGKVTTFGASVCTRMEIGLIEVSSWGDPHERCSAPLLVAPKRAKLAAVLCEEHKTFAAAGTNRGYWTPFKGFARAVGAYVAGFPRGVTAKQAALAPSLVYYKTPAAFRRNVPPLCQKGAIPTVRCVNIGGAWTLMPCLAGEERDGG